MSQTDIQDETERITELVSTIAANYISGKRDIAKAVLVRYGDEQALLALSQLSTGEFVRLKTIYAIAKARRIIATVQDGSFGTRAAKIISRRLGRTAVSNRRR